MKRLLAFTLTLLLTSCLAPVVLAQQTLNIDGINLGPPRVPLRVAGTRVTIDGANIVVEPGSTAITTLGTILAGTWNAGPVTSNGVLTGTASFELTGTANLQSAVNVGGALNVGGISTLSSNVNVGANVNPITNYTSNLGALNRKYLALHAAELWVETLVAQETMATIGGRILVGPTTALVTDLAPGTTSIQVKHNQMQNGHHVYLESDGKLEWMAVTSNPTTCGTACFQYNVTRNLDGTGANEWYAGDAVFNTGTVGNGFIDLYSISGVVSGGAGPTIVGNVRTGSAYNDIAPRWAIGNLANLYGYGSADVYGAAFGNPAGAWVKIDDQNGVRLGHASTTNVHVDSSGNAAFAGDLSAAGGTFTGALSAATGTFAGSLSAATGTFSGSLNAATGTFAGSLSAATGTFSGALNAATGTFAGTLSAATGSFATGTVTIDASGIRVNPGTDSSANAWSAGNAYAFNVANGEMGTYAGDSTSNRTIVIRSGSTSGTRIPGVNLHANYAGTGSPATSTVGVAAWSGNANIDLVTSHSGSAFNGNIRLYGIPDFRGAATQTTEVKPVVGYLHILYNGTPLRLAVYNP
jgi:hypothetical protein